MQSQQRATSDGSATTIRRRLPRRGPKSHGAYHDVGPDPTERLSPRGPRSDGALTTTWAPIRRIAYHD
eukprot:6442334-Pyramimonas_sp.AAC.1